jgi:formylglycine-generating enzyme required for sulfatase activity
LVPEGASGNVVSEDKQPTCPECHTTQSSQAPFCENCGYRIRSSDTVKEGHQAITPEMLGRVRQRRASPRGGDSAQQDTPPGADGSAAEAAPDGEESATFIEGLSAVDSADSSEQRAPADRSTERASPSSQSALTTSPVNTQPTGGRMAIYMTVWLVLTAVAVLVTYVLASGSTGEADQPAPAHTTERVEVPEGPFLRGLDDQVRSFILQMCRRVEDDPSDDCKQERILKGEYPQETVELDAFEIDTTEVSVGDFGECVSEGSCEAIDFRNCAVWTHQGLQISLRVPKALRDDAMPATCVDLSQAHAYCDWKGGSLPTSDQWEKAARGEDGRLFPWGTSWGINQANWGERDVAQTPIVGKLDGYEWAAPPGSFPRGKSPFGALDMAGNVAEWVDTGSDLQPAARGGSWTDHPFDLRATGRLALEPDEKRTDVGFRCVYD